VSVMNRARLVGARILSALAAVSIALMTWSEGVCAASGEIGRETYSYGRMPSTSGISYYVDVGRGSDSNPGTYEQPWKTIQKAANVVRPGDVVTVNAGVYAERVSITTSGGVGAIITFQANGAVTVRGFTIRGDYIRIEGFHIDLSANRTCNWSATDYAIAVYGDYCDIWNNYTTGSGHGGIILMPDSDHALVQGNVSHQDANDGIVIYGTNHIVEFNDISDVRCAPCNHNDANGIRFHGSGHVIRRNFIHDIGFTNNPGYTPHIDAFQTFSVSGHPPAQDVIIERNHVRFVEGAKDGSTTVYGFMVANATNLTIRSNVIEAWGGYNTGSTGPNSNVRIYNNTFRSSLSYPSCYWPRAVSLANTSTAQIYNNISIDFSWAHYSISGGTDIRYGHNLMWNSNGSTPAVNNYVVQPTDLRGVNPRFVSFADDLRLESISPAVDAGYNAGTLVPVDYAGVSLPQGAGYDIGAYEHVASVSPTPTPAPSGVAAPVDVVASDGTFTDRVRVTWRAATDASRYQLYVATSPTGTKTLVGETTLTWMDHLADAVNTPYSYWVTACAGSVCSDYSVPDEGWRAAIMPPTAVQASDGSYSDKVSVTWSPVAGATAYQVFYADAPTGDRIALDSVIGTTAHHTSCAPGVVYYYWVKACTNGLCSAYGESDSGWRTLPAPPAVVATDGTHAEWVHVTWPAVSGATSYRIYYGGSPAGDKQLAGTSAITEFRHSAIRPGVTYWYWIAACAGVTCSADSTPDTGWRTGRQLTLTTPDLVASSGVHTGSVRLTWSVPPGITAFQVLRANQPGDDRDSLGGTSHSTFDDITAQPGVDYYYWVVPCDDEGCGDAGAYAVGWRALAPPLELRVLYSAESGGLILSWWPALGALSYRVLGATTIDEPKTQLGTTVNTQFEHNPATQSMALGVYWVQACSGARCSDDSQPALVATQRTTTYLPLVVRE